VRFGSLYKNKWFYYGLMWGLFGLFALVFQKHILWVDETEWTLVYFKEYGFFEMIYELTRATYNMPIYYIFMWFWTRIFGLSVPMLLLPSMIAGLIGIVFITKVAEKLGGIKCGIAVCLLCVTSSLVMRMNMWEVRPYSFVFCFSAMALYYYFYRNNLKDKILFSCVLVALILTHWVASIVILFYGTFELIKIIKQRKNILELWVYIVPCVLFLIWAAFCLKNSIIGDIKYWLSNYTISYRLFFPFEYLFDYKIYRMSISLVAQRLYFNYVLLLLFICGCVFAVLKKQFRTICLCLLFVWVGVLIIDAFGTSIYHTRYFHALLPHILIVSGFGLYQTWEYLWAKKKNIRIVSCGVLVGLVSIMAICNMVYNVKWCFVPNHRDTAYWAVKYISDNMPDVVDDPESIIVFANNYYDHAYYCDKVFGHLPERMVFFNGGVYMIPETKYFDMTHFTEIEYLLAEKNGEGYHMSKINPYEYFPQFKRAVVACLYDDDTVINYFRHCGLFREESSAYNGDVMVFVKIS